MDGDRIGLGFLLFYLCCARLRDYAESICILKKELDIALLRITSQVLAGDRM